MACAPALQDGVVHGWRWRVPGSFDASASLRALPVRRYTLAAAGL